MDSAEHRLIRACASTQSRLRPCCSLIQTADEGNNQPKQKKNLLTHMHIDNDERGLFDIQIRTDYGNLKSCITTVQATVYRWYDIIQLFWLR